MRMCAVVVVPRNQSPHAPLLLEQRREFLAAARSVGWINASVGSFRCEWCAVDRYGALPNKSFALFKSVPLDCDVVVKMDMDGMLCPNRLNMSTPPPWSRRMYAGRMTYSEAAMRVMGPKLRATRQTAAHERFLRGELPSVLFAAGASYIVGRDLLSELTRVPLSTYEDTGFEDVNAGLFVSNLRDVHYLRLPGSDKHCRRGNSSVVHHRCRAFHRLCT